ncbi:MAG: VWA domain-containing protein [Eggerthellaceae bacterium]|nr:VWA domain-containing protein [Eggerthellaceae bacterium]
MPRPANFTSAPRRSLPVFYVLDTSGSMTGAPIEQLNRAMEETIDAVKQVAANNGDAQVKIAVLEFNTLARWMQPAGPEDVEDFIWTDLKAGGLTYMGEALRELNNKLSKDEFLASATGGLYPIIIFMTDGYANDEWEKQLDIIKQNRYFRRGIRIGFAMGEKADAEMIARVVGDSEAVLKTLELGLFAKLMRFVSVSSVSRQSVTKQQMGDLSGASIISELRQQGEIDDSAVDLGFSYVDPDLQGGDNSASSEPNSNSWNIEDWQ